jgi:hypothetical protein
MTEEEFNYILKNQSNWAEEYRKMQEDRQAVRRILNRRHLSKQAKSKEWIINQLLHSLQIGELELIENLANKGFRHLDLFE